MSRDHHGSLGYQMMKALQGIFRPGASRHRAKRAHREGEMISAIGTMRSMSADVHQFARFVRAGWPEVKNLVQVQPEMAAAYIQSLEERGLSGGHIGRVCASLRKLDRACHAAGIFPPEAAELLPHREQGGPGGYHARTRPLPYTREQAAAILVWVEARDGEVARLLEVMWKAGLRVSEAAYLRAADIDLEQGCIQLNSEGNENRTKGGRPRVVTYLSDHTAFFAGLKAAPGDPESGHLFAGWRGLPERARLRVRQACRALGIACLGTHAFRKAFGAALYREKREQGADDRQALRAVSLQMGHNRVEVTRLSYVPPAERVRDNEGKTAL